MSTNEPVSTPVPPPVFEGFFVEMVLPNMKTALEHVVSQNLGAAWEVKPIGDRFTEFEVSPKKDVTSGAPALSIREIWEATYRLRGVPGVIDAEPLLGVPLPEYPVHNVGDFPPPGAAFSLNQDLPESGEADWGIKQLHVYEAWNDFFPDKTPGEGIVIGHPDTGYRRHPEIADNLLVEKSHDYVEGDDDAEDELIQGWLQNPSHGTGTASVIISRRGGQGTYPSGQVMTGVAPGAKLIPFRVSPSVILLSPQNLSEAIERATDEGAHVISMSMGTGFFNKRLLTAVLYAQKRGVIVLAAAGNYVGYVVWPAAYDEVIAVAACNAQRKTWWGSSRGPKVDVTAPGESVWRAQVYEENGSLVNDVSRGYGTSFAVAAVAGVAALWLSYHGREKLIERYGAEKIPFIFNQILRTTCEEMPAWEQGSFGAGLVNARSVLAAPLPDDVNFPLTPTAFAFQTHVALDSGSFETFAHMFQTSLSVSEKAFKTTDVANAILRARLAQLLLTTEIEVPSRLAEIGQELAFHFAANPDLYNTFAASMAGSDSSAFMAPASEVVTGAAVESVRNELASKGASQALFTKSARKNLRQKARGYTDCGTSIAASFISDSSETLRASSSDKIAEPTNKLMIAPGPIATSEAMIPCSSIK